MTETLTDFCDRWLAAWTGNRPKELVHYYTQDAFYRDPAKTEGLRGSDALLAYFTKLLAKNPDWVWKRKALHPTPEGFVLLWKATLPTGDDFQGMDLVELRDQKIARNEVYFDPRPLLKTSRLRSAKSATLEFWFDFASTYSYLTASRIERVCSERGLRLIWRPFLLGPIFKEQGWNTSPFNVYPAEGKYMWTEMQRHARTYGLNHYRKPTEFPRNGLLAARVAVAAAGEPWVGRFITSVFRANFERDLDISAPEQIAALLQELGLDSAEWLSRANLRETKDQLRRETEGARQTGIFGAPAFVVSNELFWGDDRLEEACEFAVPR